jgi:hypothetical protein
VGKKEPKLPEKPEQRGAHDKTVPEGAVNAWRYLLRRTMQEEERQWHRHRPIPEEEEPPPSLDKK